MKIQTIESTSRLNKLDTTLVTSTKLIVKLIEDTDNPHFVQLEWIELDSRCVAVYYPCDVKTS